LIYSNLRIMITQNMPLNYTNTLAQRLGEGRLPVAEALRYALQLAETLRTLRDAGKVHGAVTPANLALTSGCVELLPAAGGSIRAITPYTAPEVVQGGAPDARSDIFGFGAILFEMLTGRRAVSGETRHTSPATGNAAFDRLLGPCLHRNPDTRIAGMPKVMMELKLLCAAARRAATGVGGSVERETANGAIQARISNRASNCNPWQSNRRIPRCRKPTIWWSVSWKCWNRCRPRYWIRARVRATNVPASRSTTKEYAGQ
jgi:hypothetical protein